MEGEPPRPGYVAMAKEGYGELVNAIIRPPRCEYAIRDLGPNPLGVNVASFDRGPSRVVLDRRDFELRNQRGEALQCSHWTPRGGGGGGSRRPCVVVRQMLVALQLHVHAAAMSMLVLPLTSLSRSLALSLSLSLSLSFS